MATSSKALEAGQRGFTVLELGIVLAIAAVLVAVTLPLARGQLEVAKYERLAGDLSAILDAADLLAARLMDVETSGSGPLVFNLRWPPGKSSTFEITDLSDADLALVLPTNTTGISPFGTRYRLEFSGRRVTASVDVLEGCETDEDKLRLGRRLGPKAPLLTFESMAEDMCTVHGHHSRPPGRMPNLMSRRRYLYGK